MQPVRTADQAPLRGPAFAAVAAAAAAAAFEFDSRGPSEAAEPVRSTGRVGGVRFLCARILCTSQYCTVNPRIESIAWRLPHRNCVAQALQTSPPAGFARTA